MKATKRIKRTRNVVFSLSKQRTERLLQISIASLFAVGVAAIVSQDATKPVLVSSMGFIVLSCYLAWRGKILGSASVLLVSMAGMLSVLMWMSGGVQDIGMLGYPAVLVIAAMLGNIYLFFSLLVIIVAFSSLVVVLTMQGVFVPTIPTLTYAHLIYVNCIFFVTGFGAYLLSRDMYNLTGYLKKENELVREREKQIVDLAHQDQLTGLPNRRYAENCFDDLLRASQSRSETLVVYFFDLDNFKPINDSLGHVAGDQVLQQLADRLQNICDDNDVLSRFGGDEFIWFKSIASDDEKDLEQQISENAQELLNTALQPFYIMQNTIDISGSIGIAVAPRHGNSFVDLCRAADLAMYQAKAKGRNTYSFYSEDLSQISFDRYQLLKDMRNALNNKRFEVWYQPKVDLTTNQVIACEALIRWPQPDGSFIGPDQFIPVAESSGLITRIGAYVLEQACTDCARWREQGFENVRVSINVSYVQFRSGRLTHMVEQVLRKTGLPAHMLELELTESLLINDEDELQHQIDQLNLMGVGLAIDDFGTGYSNLGYLRRFKAKVLKIDKSFVTSLGVSDRDEPLVRAMVQIAQSLGLSTIAEGVEDEATLKKLLELGCEGGQGYFWSPALSMKSWLDYLNHHGGIKKVAHVEHPKLH